MKKYLLVCLLGSVLSFVPLMGFTEEGKRVIKENENIPPFENVKMKGIAKLYITQADKQNFTIEAEDKIIPLVEISVNDNTLIIEQKPTKENPIPEGTKISYYLNIKNLKSVDISGDAALFIPKGVNTDELKLNINGSLDSDININVKKLSINLTGGGKLRVQGNAEEQEVNISGAATFDGTKLPGKTGNIRIKGAGIAWTKVSDTLNIEISGLGEVKYCGKPTITKKVSGTGSISQLKEGDCK